MFATTSIAPIAPIYFSSATTDYVAQFFSQVKTTYYTDYAKCRKVLDAAQTILTDCRSDIMTEEITDWNGVECDAHYTKAITEYLDAAGLRYSDSHLTTLQRYEEWPIISRMLNSYTHEYCDDNELDEHEETMLWSLICAMEDNFSPTFEPRYLKERIADYQSKAFTRDYRADHANNKDPVSTTKRLVAVKQHLNRKRAQNARKTGRKYAFLTPQ